MRSGPSSSWVRATTGAFRKFIMPAIKLIDELLTGSSTAPCGTTAMANCNNTNHSIAGTITLENISDGHATTILFTEIAGAPDLWIRGGGPCGIPGGKQKRHCYIHACCCGGSGRFEDQQPGRLLGLFQ